MEDYKLHHALFEVAEATVKVSPEAIERLKRKADEETKGYLPEDGGFKALYHKVHQGWIFQLLLMIATPFLTAYLVRLKTKILYGAGDDGFQDGDDLERPDSDLGGYFEKEKFL